MLFANPEQQACYEKITPWMRELFKETLTESETEPAFYVQLGSTFAKVGIVPTGSCAATICVRANVVRGARVDEPLLRFLLRRNEMLQFGAFGINDSGDVTYQYSILGPTCDKVELECAVKAVVTIADDSDDKIVRNWGGKRALDEKD